IADDLNRSGNSLADDAADSPQSDLDVLRLRRDVVVYGFEAGLGHRRLSSPLIVAGAMQQTKKGRRSFDRRPHLRSPAPPSYGGQANHQLTNSLTHQITPRGLRFWERGHPL